MAGMLLVVVGKDEASLQQFDCSYPNATVVLVANHKRLSLASIGNQYLDGMKTGVFGLCHADCVFYAGALEAFRKEAERGTICGIVGRNTLPGYQNSWCNKNPGVVSTLDSCSIFFRAGFKLRFDAVAFDGMHCHVQDLCLQGRKLRIPSVVPAANAYHFGVSWKDKPVIGERWIKDYQRYYNKLVKKWAGVPFLTT